MPCKKAFTVIGECFHKTFRGFIFHNPHFRAVIWINKKPQMLANARLRLFLFSQGLHCGEQDHFTDGIVPGRKHDGAADTDPQ